MWDLLRRNAASPPTAFCKLGFGHHVQGWQKLMDGAPYKAMDYILIVVPVDVAGGRTSCAKGCWGSAPWFRETGGAKLPR
jgi:hypothetical protein